MIKVTIEIADQPVYITVESLKIENNQIFISGIMPGVQKEEWSELSQKLSQQAETISPFQDYIFKACTEIFEKQKSEHTSTENIAKEAIIIAPDANKVASESNIKEKKPRLSKTGKPAATGTKTCFKCGKEYKPTSNAQVVCAECKDRKTEVKKLKEVYYGEFDDVKPKTNKPDDTNITKTKGIKICSICKKEFKFTHNSEKRCPECKGLKVKAEHAPVSKAPIPELKNEVAQAPVVNRFAIPKKPEVIKVPKILLDPMNMKQDPNFGKEV